MLEVSREQGTLNEFMEMFFKKYRSTLTNIKLNILIKNIMEGKMARYTESKKKNNKKWDDAHIFRKGVALPIEYKDIIQKKLDAEGISFNAYIRRLVEKDIGIYK